MRSELKDANEAQLRTRQKQRERMAAFRLTPAYRVWVDESRENRKQLKAKYRREKGIKTVEQKHIETVERKLSKQLERNARALHDSHVKAFKSDAARYSRWKHAHVPSYAMYHRLKSWMHKHLGDLLPSRKWSHYLGYSTAELRCHLERQFSKGMTWENKGKWHIDHIRPVASFNIQSVESDEFRDCFGLHNLRPVWAKENMRKGAKREFLL